MNILYKCLLGIFCFSFHIQGFEHEILKDAKDCIFFLSYPRTGTSWSLSSIQYLTDRITPRIDDYPLKNHIHKYPRNDVGDFNFLYLDLDSTKEPVYAVHSPCYIDHVNQDTNKLVVIVRNYREALLRHFKYNPNGDLEIGGESELLSAALNYLENLKCYEGWNKENRFIYYYEDLMNNPRKTFQNLISFLNDSNQKLDYFIENIDTYKQKCLAGYHKSNERYGGSISKGKDLHFHSRQVSSKVIKYIDQIIRKHAGKKIWNKYLERYCVQLPEES